MSQQFCTKALLRQWLRTLLGTASVKCETCPFTAHAPFVIQPVFYKRDASQKNWCCCRQASSMLDGAPLAGRWSWSRAASSCEQAGAPCATTCRFNKPLHCTQAARAVAVARGAPHRRRLCVLCAARTWQHRFYCAAARFTLGAPLAVRAGHPLPRCCTWLFQAAGTGARKNPQQLPSSGQHSFQPMLTMQPWHG